MEGALEYLRLISTLNDGHCLPFNDFFSVMQYREMLECKLVDIETVFLLYFLAHPYKGLTAEIKQEGTSVI